MKRKPRFGCIPKTTARKGNVAEDLAGRRFGKLVVMKRAENKNSRVRWLCQCDCGNQKVCTAQQLKAGHVTSCGCRVNAKNVNYKDLSGTRFGRLTALYPTLERDKKGSIKWKCICDCGNEHFVTEDALVNGNVQSCGSGSPSPSTSSNSPWLTPPVPAPSSTTTRRRACPATA